VKELLALSVGSIPSLKYAERVSLLENLGGVDEFRSLKPIDLASLFHRVPRNTIWDPGTLLEGAEKIASSMEKKGVLLLTPLDSLYPPQLKEIYDPPFLIFYRGALPSWNETFLAVVGTRKPTVAGRKAAYTLAKEASGMGIVIVSGLARGIDGEAHRGALDGGGKTIAVLGHGPDTVYPISNRKLGERILQEGGLFLSEYPPGTAPLPYHFPARNRIISGLCRGTLVIEAPVGSGALITADFALEQGRDLWVHKVGIESPQGGGTRRLGEEGAPVIETSLDILNHWGMRGTRNTDVPVERVKNTAMNLAPGQWLAEQLREELKRKR
jgi:DNA processing protein